MNFYEITIEDWAAFEADMASDPYDYEPTDADLCRMEAESCEK